MGKKLLVFCDLCKKEEELDHSIIIKPTKSKKSSRSYDICNQCKELLEKSLISNERSVQFKNHLPTSNIETSENPKEDEHTLVLPNGTTRNIVTRAEVGANNQIISEEVARDLPEGMNKQGNRCVHMNRTRPRITAQSQGKIFIQCKDCGVEIEYKSSRTRAQEININDSVPL